MIYVTHDQVEAVALADRVVVMDLGVIQQIGTPLDLYYRPANLFVAGFIGEPPMNLIPCTLTMEGGALRARLQARPDLEWRYTAANLPQAALRALQAYHNRPLVAGVRPQRLALGAPAVAPTDGALPGRLLVHEFLGKDGIAQAEVDGTVLECITPPTVPFQAGDPVSLTAAFEDMLFFDPESTRRIEY
jgi:ABC-type sugar transport system ATPase subunit